jgi:hypothetical protein
MRLSSNKKERIIDLTDIGRRNSMPVVRDNDDEIPVLRSINDSPTDAIDPVNFIAEDRDQGYSQPKPLVDPDGQYEEQLEAEGATIINSTTYFPDSKRTITKRSQTPEERAEQRMFEYYNNR